MALIALCAATASAADVTLKWDAPEGKISGYRIYAVPVPEAYDYEIPLHEGTATSCTVGIDSNIKLKFVARAFLIGDSGEVYESANSNEVRHAVVVCTNPNLRVE